MMRLRLPLPVLTGAIVTFTYVHAAAASTLEAGPGKTYATPCTAIAAAMPGDTVEVSPGTAAYTDSCEINAAGLTVKGVGGQPTLDLSGTMDPADDKGIFVVNANDVTIDNLELTGANVSIPNGANGAGIRDQASGLVVLNCYIHDNQDGILATATDAGSTLIVEYTELSHNGLGAGCDNGGCTHNIYVGTGAGGNYESFTFAFNWSHDIADDTADKGHLLKTRAMNNYILYNALLGETGHDSIELDIPNGGFSVVVGNIIEKGPSCDDNPNLLDYGEEGLTNPTTALYVASNTFVSAYTSSVDFINVASGGTLTAHNNLFNGMGTESTTGTLSADNLAPASPMFVDPTTYDYHLMTGSPAVGQGVSAGAADGFSLTPVFEYVQPIEGVGRVMGAKLDVGAFQLGTVTTGAGQGATVTDSDAGVPSLPDDAGAVSAGDGGSSSQDGGSSHSPEGGVSGGAEAGRGGSGGSGSGSGGSGKSGGGARGGDAGGVGGDGSTVPAASSGGCQVGSGPMEGVWIVAAFVGVLGSSRRSRSKRASSGGAGDTR